MSSAFSPARRQLFRGDVGARHLPQRPPWTLAEVEFVDGCTRCTDCVNACPERIIKVGSGGYPEIDFSHGECTFCTDCVRACKAPVFRSTDAEPWPIRALIGDGCITHKQVVCRSCEEQCEPLAIGFAPVAGRIPTPTVDLDRCTGCGACVAVCPTRAITIQPPGAGE